MKERWDLNRRAVRLLYHLDRKYFLCTLFSSLTTAIAPYIPIYFSAKIIDALTAGAGGKTLALYAALTVGLTALVGLAGALLKMHADVGEAELDRLGAELAKIEEVESQVTSALAAVERQEAEATAAFVKEGGALKDALARIEAERAMLASSLPADLLDAYKKTAARTGGVAVGRLQGSNCGVCRMAIEGGRLIDMKGQGNVAPCPQCGRLLILE